MARGSLFFYWKVIPWIASSKSSDQKLYIMIWYQNNQFFEQTEIKIIDAILKCSKKVVFRPIEEKKFSNLFGQSLAKFATVQ